MKYAMLIYNLPGSHEALPDSQQASVYREYMEIADDARCVQSERLAPLATATTVRVNGTDTLTTDGPFEATKEVLGGYYIFEAGDLDEAIEVATRIPTARLGGSVEIRPVVES